MKWEKCGLLWKPADEAPWARSHATLPVVQVVGPDRWWVYVSTRDEAGKSRIGRLVVDPNKLPADGRPAVCLLDPVPVLSLGEPGTFDDSGVMPSWLVHDGDTLRLYYIGWNVIGTVPYRVSIGLAISRDGGATFQRFSRGPVVDRNAVEPFFVTTPCVHKEHELWRMWYASCTGWQQIEGRWEPSYHVKYAESRDGLEWNLRGISCIDAGESHAIARPCVFRNGGGYLMFYSYRGLSHYRQDVHQAYRLGYAESRDGIHWSRQDDRVGITRSESGWDSEMMEYCWVQKHRDATYLLYNGNGFGASGIGIARLVERD
jgi:hypothetical protein